jgi:hypothetical protein
MVASCVGFTTIEWRVVHHASLLRMTPGQMPRGSRRPCQSPIRSGLMSWQRSTARPGRIVYCHGERTVEDSSWKIWPGGQADVQSSPGRSVGHSGSQTITVLVPYGLLVPAPTSTQVLHTAHRPATRLRIGDSRAEVGVAAVVWKSSVPWPFGRTATTAAGSARRLDASAAASPASRGDFGRGRLASCSATSALSITGATSLVRRSATGHVPSDGGGSG